MYRHCHAVSASQGRTSRENEEAHRKDGLLRFWWLGRNQKTCASQATMRLPRSYKILGVRAGVRLLKNNVSASFSEGSRSFTSHTESKPPHNLFHDIPLGTADHLSTLLRPDFEQDGPLNIHTAQAARKPLEISLAGDVRARLILFFIRRQQQYQGFGLQLLRNRFAEHYVNG